jgi:hypothetical protein
MRLNRIFKHIDKLHILAVYVHVYIYIMWSFAVIIFKYMYANDYNNNMMSMKIRDKPLCKASGKK